MLAKPTDCSMLAGVDVSYSRGEARSVVLAMAFLMRGMLKFKPLKRGEWGASRSGKVPLCKWSSLEGVLFWWLLCCGLEVSQGKLEDHA